MGRSSPHTDAASPHTDAACGVLASPHPHRLRSRHGIGNGVSGSPNDGTLSSLEIPWQSLELRSGTWLLRKAPFLCQKGNPRSKESLECLPRGGGSSVFSVPEALKFTELGPSETNRFLFARCETPAHPVRDTTAAHQAGQIHPATGSVPCIPGALQSLVQSKKVTTGTPSDGNCLEDSRGDMLAMLRCLRCLGTRSSPELETAHPPLGAGSSSSGTGAMMARPWSSSCSSSKSEVEASHPRNMVLAGRESLCCKLAVLSLKSDPLAAFEGILSVGGPRGHPQHQRCATCKGRIPNVDHRVWDAQVCQRAATLKGTIPYAGH